MSGMIAVYSQDESISIQPYLYQGTMSLQHRGQQGFGLAIGEDVQYGNGLLSDATLSSRVGHYGVASVKYAFTQSKKMEPLMPYRAQQGFWAIDGDPFQGMHVLDELLQHNKSYEHVMSENQGAYALISINEHKMIAVRDPLGIKPLVMGRNENIWIIASETCALEALGASDIRDIQPGEVVVIDKNGMQSHTYDKARLYPCLFEYIYIARPDSVMNGISIYEARKKMGELLYKECPTQADIVIGAPDSGLLASLGYANASNIQYEKGLVKNRYIGRTFIDPDSLIRKQSVVIKLNAISSVVKDRDVILVEDSIVRGTTITRIIKILREKGARKVHVRVAAPPVLFEENISIDIPNRESLMCYGKTIEEVRDEIGCDSLYFLSLAGLKKACGGTQFYTQYFDGKSPLKGDLNDI